MAKTTNILVKALYVAAGSLSDDDSIYQWGHMGQCNVGHLVQAMTGLTDSEIVETADEQFEEWSEHARLYCIGTGRRLDDIFDTLKTYNFSTEDVIHLENLSDRRVLKNLPGGFRYLSRNQREDVASYMLSLADLLAKAA
ncbi:MAG: hypothetical protein HRU19_07060 [Pseudobacteriovorax sp.]|nr:hypothetical protein [Pseudobacteriovorax sp.]